MQAASPKNTLKRAIALRCVLSAGPFVYGQIYLAFRGSRPGPLGTPTWFYIRPDNDTPTRTVEDRHFEPVNPEHWPLFSDMQRRLFAPPFWQPRQPRLSTRFDLDTVLHSEAA